ncbi:MULTISPECIES: PP2C family serine/threonine-protein phosphatase [unclassified Actinotalea]|uniref:PP2C family protein-serine/threonine phosphatase n=1 Tax=unclassified Actinotalea TaxID=2638618 RepID=UPI0015F676E9|nr:MULTISPECIES: protein phosphatase 2C domain-containing protein [unclassified Actinotalea]
MTAARSITGPHRADNQDSVGCGPCFAFVADGVGGHAGGDVASWTVTHRLMAMLATTDLARLELEDLREMVAQANADLALRADREPRLNGMATTFTGLFCAHDEVSVAHIGDSRAYLVRDGEGRRVTRDDSLVQALVDQGLVDARDAQHHPNRNVILRSLSGDVEDTAGLSLMHVEARPGDRWLLTSDGLTDYVAEAQLLRRLADADGPEEASDALVEAAVAADAHDNVSVAVCDVSDGTPGPEDRPRYLGAAADPAQGFQGALG